MVPLVLLALAACTDGTQPAPDEQISSGPLPGKGTGNSELPTVDDQRGALQAAGESAEALVSVVAGDATATGQVADVAAGPHVLRVVCTSSDGAPLTVTVAAGETELTSYQAPCVPVYQGGTTMADSDAFEVPAGTVDITVAAGAESVVAVGLAAAPAAG